MTVLDRPVETRATDVPARHEPSWRVRVFAACVALVSLAFLQDPGRVAADTKLDLTVNPWGLLGRSLHLWDPEGFFGQLQNQAYGYLWPMGPFFGVGHSLGLPDWVVQRLWWSLVLVTAFLGMYALLRVMRIGAGWPVLLAALGYALAVRPQSAIGAVSVEVWPMAVAPWVLVPLVVGAVRGNPARAAALSALAVTSAGGVNAVAAGAVLPLSLWWLLTREPGPRRRQLLAWWSGLTLLAILWWLIPLLVLGRYSPPFLDWIESAEYVTSVTDPTSVLRGADHWLAYLGNASEWTAGWLLATEPVLVVATGLVAAAGVAGLAMRSLPHRLFLTGAAVGGLVLVSAGHTGVFSGLGSEQVQDFLDGIGAPLRNTHKFDLVLRIPLTIAFAHLLVTVWPRAAKPRWRPLLVGVLVGALVVGWWPTLSGQLTRDRSYVAVADHWRDASRWLNERAEPGRALIVPGASFGQYVWGRTQDEPLQAFGGYPWGVRDAVPLSSAGNIRMLDAVESRLEAGLPSPGLGPYLNRMGVRYLVVRNDLSPSARAPLPIRVHQALDGSLGLNRVAWFGPVVDRPLGGEVIQEEGLRVSYPAVEIYEVRASDAAPDARAVLRPASPLTQVQGAPESLLALADLGILGNRAAVLSGDPQAGRLPAATQLSTDTDRRREITFGYMRANESATMSADQQYVQARPVHDYRVFGEEGTTVALPGLRFDASSSASDVGATWRQPRGAMPAAAMDGSLETYWRPGALNERRSFWEVRFDKEVDLPANLRIALFNRGSKGDTTIPLRISTDNGTTSVDARDDAKWQRVEVAPGLTRHVRVAVPEQYRSPLLGIREIDLPGRRVDRLRLPRADEATGIVLTARPGDAGSCVPRDDQMICSDGLERFSQDRLGLHRRLELAAPMAATPRILVAPRASGSLADELRGLGGLEARATSTRTDELAGSAFAAVDRRLGTAWQAAPDDSVPALTIVLPRERTIRGIRLTNRQGLNASSPLELQVVAAGRTFSGFTDNRGLFRIGPVDTDTVEISIRTTNQVRSRSDLGEISLPVGISEVGLVGADETRQPLPGDAVVSLPCGAGPEIRVDGRRVARTTVTSRIDRLVEGRPARVQVCEGAPVTIPAGEHDVDVVSSRAFRPVAAAFVPASARTSSGRPESPEVRRWDAAARVVEVGPGDADRVLEVNENFNEGWTAQASGRPLEALRLDGWKQGFVVPADVNGPVELVFAPDRPYRLGLLVGFLAVLAVAAVAVRPPRVVGGPALGPRSGTRLLTGMLAAGVLLVLGPWGLLVYAASLALVRRPPVVALAAIGTAVALSAVAGIRPGAAVVVLQGCAVAVALAAVTRAGWPVGPRATSTSDPSGSSAAPGAR